MSFLLNFFLSPCRTVEIEPVVRVATAHSNAILATKYYHHHHHHHHHHHQHHHRHHHLISTVIWFALAPLSECERIPIGPLEGALL